MGTDPKKDTYVKDWMLDREQPQHEVHLSSYNMSRYPVTNAQYHAFVEDGGYADGKWRHCWTLEGWEWKEDNAKTGPAKYGGEFDLPNYPVVVVSWYEAAAFCNWLTLRLREHGKLSDDQSIRLPTEAEWEKAARGDDGRIYPWGNKIGVEFANYADTGLGATSA
ncbi:MAG: formylglycine-generating enzyme family protein, partial [Gammaproteobacteria bacterium]|nr:formylglycine-generating enzyme family protein [Gammaproteobacteria bacterium]